jgi:ligand-binding SRPBCC domain-containing protein
MRYIHRFRVQAPLSDVDAFHRRSASMAAITPPPIIVRIHSAPQLLQDGDQMDFTMWLGPLPIRWLAQIEANGESGFIDRQQEGPFAEWVHRHAFIAVDDKSTEVVDEVFVSLHEASRFWQLIGFSMWMSLPLLFAYRAWKTRRILESV